MTHPCALTPSAARHVALHALVGQGKYGVVTQLAREHGLRREQVYELREHARSALDEGFMAVAELGAGEADLKRAVVALRVMTPASLRDIRSLLPILCGEAWSYGKIWNVLHEAEGRASEFLRQVDLSGVTSVALDEMFSQGRPVFAGIDLDTGYLVQLEVHEDRRGETWAEALGALRDNQGLKPAQVVKDAGSGLGSGVRTCWPEAEEIDDLFHAVRELGKVGWALEQRAYSAIAREEEARLERQRVRRFSTDRFERQSAGARYGTARRRAQHAIERFDRFDTYQKEIRDILRLCDRGSGRLRRPEEVETMIIHVSSEIRALGGKRCRKLATYLRNRAPGLGRYLVRLNSQVEEATEAAGGERARDAAIRCYQAALDVHRGGPKWDRSARQEELEEAVRGLHAVTDRDPEALRRTIGAIFPLLVNRHRASSAIENLNSVLRPYVFVQKSAGQGFLNLFQFYWNTRTREWGRWKGTSAYGSLTGKEVGDWLTLLGYPPSEAIAAAA